jgi:AcrR family transcriptional regulator
MESQRRMPVQERAQATVEALLEATAQVLVEVGYARLSTNRVARRAGVSVGSLYQYFADKDALVEALARRVTERQVAVILAQLERIDDLPLEVAVRSLIDGMLAAKRVEPELSQALVREVPRQGRLDMERATLRRLAEVISATLRRRADIRTVDAEVAAFALVHATFAVMQAALEERPELIAGDALAQTLTELCSRYLSA